MGVHKQGRPSACCNSWLHFLTLHAPAMSPLPMTCLWLSEALQEYKQGSVVVASSGQAMVLLSGAWHAWVRRAPAYLLVFRWVAPSQALSVC
jgi:hypothetical protein